MTCNQLITLLNIYRGTEDLDSRIGTYENDIKSLFAMQLIEKAMNPSSDGDIWLTTELGTNYVQKCLGLKLNVQKTFT